MDVRFETPQGRRFTIQIWYFSTVRRIKEYILRHEGIPVETQQLFFTGRELQDDHDTEYYSILHGSHILLVIRNGSPAIAKTHTTDVHVVISVPSLGRSITFNLKTSDTIAQLKELLQEHTNGALLVDRVTFFFNGVEMEEGKVLVMYNPPVDGMEVDAVVTQLPHKMKAKEPQWMKVKVKQGPQMVILEVSNLDVVKELRTEVGRVTPHFLQPVNGAGYSFVYRENVMDEDRTLCWHKFKNGDTIEILKGDITQGD